MLTSKFFYIIVTAILLIVFFTWQMTAYDVAEPNFTVVETDGDIEIRKYPALLIAEVSITGDREKAINSGFKTLANFIFGNNETSSSIAMTAPVIEQKTGDTWKIRFLMPADFNLQNLPKPNNKSISILQSKAKNYIVIRFSGSSSEGNLKEHETMLREYAKKHGLLLSGEPLYAFYNPPWILPFLRRNEIMFEI